MLLGFLWEMLSLVRLDLLRLIIIVSVRGSNYESESENKPILSFELKKLVQNEFILVPGQMPLFLQLLRTPHKVCTNLL